MKYKTGFLAICCSSVVFLFIFLLWSDNANQNFASIDQWADFGLLLDSNICQNDSTAVQIVTSYAGNTIERTALRRAYPADELSRLGISRVFLLGKLHSGRQQDLEQESQKYGDIIQGDFYESYHNLTLKHVMGLEWASVRCFHVRYIIKMDDDILVDMYGLRKLLNSDVDLMGYVLEHKKPIREKNNKWYVTKREYDGNYYPPFLSGWLYITTPKVATSLVTKSRQMPYFWIDDLFLTGVVASELKLPLRRMNEQFVYHPELVECCIRAGVKCGFLVAPTGGDSSLQVSFQHHAFRCDRGHCADRKGNRTIEETCVASRRLPRIKKGKAHFKVIRL